MTLWILTLFLLFILWLYKLNKSYHILAFFAPRLKTVDGSPVQNIARDLPASTIFGNTFDVLGLDFAEAFKFFRQCAAEMKGNYIYYICGITVLSVIDADLMEIISTDKRLTKKGFMYDFLKMGIGEGLLISSGKKWHARRKMLTPAFHFNILVQFVEIFKEESQKFIEELENLSTDILVLDEVIPKLTLNIVCETALGIKLDDCSNGDEYRESFEIFEQCVNKRVLNPFYYIEPIFKLFEKSKYLPAFKIIHDFSSNIIEKKRNLLEKELEPNGEAELSAENAELNCKKKRSAMLDTLLKAEKDGLIDHAGICEEVDTFIFEGSDSTAVGLILCLMNLSLYPEMQERCYREIMQTIDNFDNLNTKQLNELKYLECFLKETMRLYPFVPLGLREAVQETQLANGLVLPPKANVALHFFDMHRNPKYFENPNTFDPERFTPERSAGRHPYAYVPFSVGQRNCIGQKFAMFALKTVLVYVIKHFKLLPMMDPEKIFFQTGFILRTKDKIKVKLVKRHVKLF